jgi:hypothetical protein
MLGRLRMNIDDAIKAYKELAPQIFKGKWWTQNQAPKFLGTEARHYWLEGKNLVEAIESFLSKKGLDKGIKLLEPSAPVCRTYVFLS